MWPLTHATECDVTWLYKQSKLNKSLPRQICIIVAVTNTIITGAGAEEGKRGERMTEDTERRGGALILHLHATCEDDKAKQKKKIKIKTSSRNKFRFNLFLQKPQDKEQSFLTHQSLSLVQIKQNISSWLQCHHWATRWENVINEKNKKPQKMLRMLRSSCEPLDEANLLTLHYASILIFWVTLVPPSGSFLLLYFTNSMLQSLATEC